MIALAFTVLCVIATLVGVDADSPYKSFVELETSTNYTYINLDEYGVDVKPDQSFIRFQVRAKNDVHLALLETEGYTKNNMYEIVIGGWSNRQSAIRNYQGGKPLAKASHNPLKESEFRDFWVSWKDGMISVGKGAVAGQGKFMQWKNPKPHKVNYISVTTGWGSSGSWIFDISSYVELQTSKDYKYINLDPLGVKVDSGQTSFMFEVRAQHDAHVALLDSPGSKNLYEVVLGGWNNKHSVIRNSQMGKPMTGASHEPLSGSEFRAFWISWKGGVIYVGTGGVVGEGAFMKWKDPSPHKVNYISVSTGWGSVGSWRFEGNTISKGSSLGISTGNDYIYRSVPDVSSDSIFHSVTFYVQASNDAYIALLSNEDDTKNMYEILIGGWSNNYSAIRNRRSGSSLAFAKHKPLSSKQHLPFWICVHQGTISVGHGTVVGRQMFMSWTDTSPSPVKFISVATGWGATGHWLFCEFLYL